MKTGTLWIIRVALSVQFLGVLAVPALVAADQSPRAVWMAEWLNPAELALIEWPPSLSEGRLESNGRAIGVLRLHDDKLTFVEQIGLVDWELDLARVKKVAASGHALLVVSMTGDEYLLTIMEPDLTPGSPRRALEAIERAIELQTADGR